MNWKTLFLLVALLPMGCGGSPESDTQTAADAQPSAAEAPAPERAPAAADRAAPRETAAPAAQASDEPVRLAQADGGGGLDSSRWQEGVHYQRLSPVQPTSTGPEQVEVAEFFMYSCIHCYNFDPYLEEWKQTIPGYVNFVRVPTVWNPVVRLHAQAYYTAEALGKLDEMHADFFREMHVEGNFMQTEAALADFFERYGVETEQFEQTFDSFAVHTKLQRADELARRYRVSSTPTMVVNGKYVTNASMTGGYDALIELIDDLAASEASGD